MPRLTGWAGECGPAHSGSQVDGEDAEARGGSRSGCKAKVSRWSRHREIPAGGPRCRGFFFSGSTGHRRVQRARSRTGPRHPRSDVVDGNAHEPGERRIGQVRQQCVSGSRARRCANSLAELCARVDADIIDVTRCMGADHRIGAAFLAPGPGWGGSCLPRRRCGAAAHGSQPRCRPSRGGGKPRRQHRATLAGGGQPAPGDGRTVSSARLKLVFFLCKSDTSDTRVRLRWPSAPSWPRQVPRSAVTIGRSA